MVGADDQLTTRTQVRVEYIKDTDFDSRESSDPDEDEQVSNRSSNRS